MSLGPRAKRTRHFGMLVRLRGADDERAIRSAGNTAKELYDLALFVVIDVFKPVSKRQAALDSTKANPHVPWEKGPS